MLVWTVLSVEVTAISARLTRGDELKKGAAWTEPAAARAETRRDESIAELIKEAVGRCLKS